MYVDLVVSAVFPTYYCRTLWKQFYSIDCTTRQKRLYCIEGNRKHNISRLGDSGLTIISWLGESGPTITSWVRESGTKVIITSWWRKVVQLGIKKSKRLGLFTVMWKIRDVERTIFPGGKIFRQEYALHHNGSISANVFSMWNLHAAYFSHIGANRPNMQEMFLSQSNNNAVQNKLKIVDRRQLPLKGYLQT